MGKVIHKQGPKKVIKYVGLGKYEKIYTPLCDGPKGLYDNKTYIIHRLWKYVTCKKCLRKRANNV